MALNGQMLDLARRFKVGRAFYRTYYAPAGFLSKCRQEGLANVLLSRLGRARMAAAAARLPAVHQSAQGPVLDLHFLSGRDFWYQTCFCAFSMIRHSDVSLRPILYDDGTFSPLTLDRIRRLFPLARFESSAAIESRLNDALPASCYPSLRARRLVYPHLRKLTDVHAGLRGWKMVLDSDMLFYRKPSFLLDWMRHPDRPCTMVDVADCYGYPMNLMSELAEAPIPGRVNVGVCGLKSEDIDWDRLEYWCQQMLERAGSHYLQEQALTAMLLAGQNCAIAPPDDYVAKPARDEVRQPGAIMHHYVAESKAWYFRYGWKHIANNVSH